MRGEFRYDACIFYTRKKAKERGLYKPAYVEKVLAKPEDHLTRIQAVNRHILLLKCGCRVIKFNFLQLSSKLHQYLLTIAEKAASKLESVSVFGTNKLY